MEARHSINQDDLRNHNLSVILDTILRSDTPLSRAELAKRTGLTKATLSLLAALLIDNCVVKELDREKSATKYGRPSTPLTIRGGLRAGIGMQINTDGYGCLALDLDGSLIDSDWVSEDMSDADPDRVFGALESMVSRMTRKLESSRYTIVGSGLALPGLVDDNLHLLMARNLGWDRLDLNQFRVVSQLHTQVGNEAKMAALCQIPGYATKRAEHQTVSAISPSDSFIYISTDIGIGGAVVKNGTIWYGDHGFAGELGHVCVDINGPICRCGRRGCLEVYAGRRALVEAAGIASGHEATSVQADKKLYELWRQGDAKAVAAIDRALTALISVITSTMNILDIGTVVLGGFWNNFADGLSERLQTNISSSVLAGSAIPVRVFNSNLTPYPALYGAAEVGLRQFVDNPLHFLSVS